MNKIYFITGSQDLYGEDVLEEVAKHSRQIVDSLNQKLSCVELVYQPIVLNNKGIIDVMERASLDRSCIGIITWMHTFSPAKMWIKGLQRLSKPLFHLHTQFNEKLPYQTIDMNFMNLNQSAHGDREFGFILARLNIPHCISVGYYLDLHVIQEIEQFGRIAKAIALSKELKVAMFGSNMREVAVTDGDRVESQIHFGWEVNYYGIGDLVDCIANVKENEVDELMHDLIKKYTINTNNIEAVMEQCRYEIGLRKFLQHHQIDAFADTFQDLHGLNQLPGLAIQRLHNEGYGFSAEGDYKTSALSAIMIKMAEGLKGSTGFIEDYTYDFRNSLVLGSHMLEVTESFAKSKPSIEVHPLGIGGKSDPARLVFDGVTGEGISVCMTDMGDRFRIICAKINLVNQPEVMPNLPVARIMWELKPNFEDGIKAWLRAGGGHHTVVSTALTVDDLRIFADLTNTEIIVIE